MLAAARLLTLEPLPPARGLAEGNPRLMLLLLAALFRARHGLSEAAAAAAGQMSQFAQWLEEYDVQVPHCCCCSLLCLPVAVAECSNLPHIYWFSGQYISGCERFLCALYLHARDPVTQTSSTGTISPLAECLIRPCARRTRARSAPSACGC